MYNIFCNINTNFIVFTQYANPNPKLIQKNRKFVMVNIKISSFLKPTLPVPIQQSWNIAWSLNRISIHIGWLGFPSILQRYLLMKFVKAPRDIWLGSVSFVVCSTRELKTSQVRAGFDHQGFRNNFKERQSTTYKHWQSLWAVCVVCRTLNLY